MTNGPQEKANSFLAASARYLSDRSQPHGAVYILLALANDPGLSNLSSALDDLLTNWLPFPPAMAKEFSNQVDRLGTNAPHLALAKAVVEFCIAPQNAGNIAAVASLLTAAVPRCLLEKLIASAKTSVTNAGKRKSCFVQLAATAERIALLDLQVTALEVAVAADRSDSALAAQLRNAVAAHHLSVEAVGRGGSYRESVRDPAAQAALEAAERIAAVPLSEVDQLRLALAAEPHSAAIACRLADLLLKRGGADLLAEARAALEAADRSNNPRAEYLLARAKRKQLQLTKSIGDPRSDREVLALAILEAEALSVCDRNNLEHRMSLARLLVAAERFSDAVRLFQQLLQLHSNAKERLVIAQELALAFAKLAMFEEAYLLLQWCVMQPTASLAQVITAMISVYEFANRKEAIAAAGRLQSLIRAFSLASLPPV